MLTLFHHPLCPHSRFVRVALGEYGLPINQVGERVWERREDFLVLNPACTVPVLVTEDAISIPGASVIAEYLDEVYGATLTGNRLLPVDPDQRIEVRRLMQWFNNKFFEEVTGPLTTERYKQYISPDAGGGSPDYVIIRAARANIPYHLAYIDWLLGNREWLAGGSMSYVDLAAAAHLSTADYLGDIPWTDDGAARRWYNRMQERRSFQSMMAQAWRGFIRT